MVTATRRAPLARLLRKQAERAKVASGLSAAVDLEAGREHWTIRLDDGRMEVEPGEPESPDARIVTDAGTV